MGKKKRGRRPAGPPPAAPAPPPRPWTGQDDAFLEAIRDEPDGDVHRLVYADWLEEQGDPARAEFIRLQCQLAQMPPDAPRRQELMRRQEELLSAHGGRWALPESAGAVRSGEAVLSPESTGGPALSVSLQLGGAAPARAGVRFHRGFVDELQVTGGDLTCAGLVLRHHPVRTLRRVTPRRSTAIWRRLADWPALCQVRELALGGLSAEEDLRRLLASPHLTRLTGLHFLVPTDSQGGRWAGLLAAAPLLGRLRRLSLGGRVGSEGLRDLLDSHHFRPTELSLPGHYSPGSVEDWAIYDATQTPNVGSAGVVLLAGAPVAAGLKALDLRHNGLEEPAVRALIESPYLDNLDRLVLAEPADVNPGFAAHAAALRARFGAKLSL
jgi:uncharacterized protein (TIGR02996 family)